MQTMQARTLARIESALVKRGFEVAVQESEQPNIGTVYGFHATHVAAQVPAVVIRYTFYLASFTLFLNVRGQDVEAPRPFGDRFVQSYVEVSTFWSTLDEHLATFASDSEIADALSARLEEAGFVIEQTGGGCTAWHKDLRHSGYVRITSEGGDSHKIGPDGAVIGVYTNKGDGGEDSCLLFTTSHISMVASSLDPDLMSIAIKPDKTEAS